MDYRQQILNILHSESESRAEMPRRLGVTKAYINKITARLLDEQLIEEREVKDALFGRPQQCLSVKEGNAWSVNIMLRRGSFQTTLDGNWVCPWRFRQLNERLRKTLDYESPAERFNKCVASIG